MAKGFTVKAKAPSPSQAPEWDYNLAREMVKGEKTIPRIIHAPINLVMK